MSEDERDILVTKRKYWTKLMKYNLVNTVLFWIYMFPVTNSDIIFGECDEYIKIETASVRCASGLYLFWLWFYFLVGSWILLFVMYGYHSFKIYKITKPTVLAKSSEMSLRSTQKHNGAMGEDEITRLKSIADLRDSGVLTDDEFQEQKSRILAESTGVSSNQTHYSGEGEPPMEDNSRYLFYILSFLIPLAGVIIGIIYHGKPEPWHKEFGKKCLELALTAIAIVFLIGLLSILSILRL
jgi:hypothetical protein